MELNKKAYDEYVKQITPVNELGSDMLHAFVTGGTICALGQASVMLMMNYLGMEKEDAQTWMLVELILTSILLTGFGIYPKIVKWGEPGHWFLSPALRIPWWRLLLSIRQRDTCSGLDVRFSPLQDR